MYDEFIAIINKYGFELRYNYDSWKIIDSDGNLMYSYPEKYLAIKRAIDYILTNIYEKDHKC